MNKALTNDLNKPFSKSEMQHEISGGDASHQGELEELALQSR